MSSLTIEIIDSVADLQRQADAWDDLWWRSDVLLPTVRAAAIALYHETFARRSEFRAVVVRDGSSWVAALPLVSRRLGRCVNVGALPANDWASSGELLLDPEYDAAEVLDRLVEGLDQLPWPMLWLDMVEIDRPRWKAFRRALERRKRGLEVRNQYCVGVIHIDDDWSAYQGRWSKNLRRNMRRGRRKLDADGAISFQRYTHLAGSRLDEVLETVLDVEDRSWKGPAGTSIFRTAGMPAYFQRLAAQVAQWGQLEILVLTHDEWPIAIDFGYRAKGAYYSHKIGFDETYAQYSPGQLLMQWQLEQYFEGNEIDVLDCMGPLSEAAAKWCTGSYPVARLVVGMAGIRGATFMGAYQKLWPHARRLRAAISGPSPCFVAPALGAARTNAPSVTVDV